MSDEICEELSIQPCAVTAVAGHDTQCAMVAVPTEKDDFIFLSCGTWSLLGTELSEPLINEKRSAAMLQTRADTAEKRLFLKYYRSLAYTGDSPTVAKGGRQPFVCRDGDSRTKREAVFLLYRPRRSRFCCRREYSGADKGILSQNRAVCSRIQRRNSPLYL